MKRKKGAGALICLTVGIALLLVLYLVIGFYYREGFSFGTYVNGVYCTGKSVETVNEELKALYGETVFTVQDAFERTYEIPLESVDFTIDYTSQLQMIQSGESPFLWIMNLAGGSSRKMAPQISLDEELLAEQLTDCGILKDNDKKQTVEIRNEQGYVLYDGRKQVLSEEKLITRIGDALRGETLMIDVSDCYEDLSYTPEMEETLLLWNKVEAFMDCGIIYDMGDAEVSLTPEITSKWITLDEKGNFLFDEEGNLILDESGVEDFVAELASEYDTLDSTRTFQSTRGDAITIEGGTYGNQLDQKEEVAYLTEAFLNKVREVHVPAYEKEAYVRGKNDIGDTYVEIDMTDQKLYCYIEGECVLDTDIVTGNTGRRMGTPSGTFYVYNLQRNRTLRGEGYASFVKYWAPVKGGVGIHDASWRKEFGGEIYKTNGSHGCINVPRDKMTELYDMLFIGMPVVMFY